MGNEVSCNLCGRMLSVGKTFETKRIKGIKYRVHENGEYYEKVGHWGYYKCRECFFERSSAHRLSKGEEYEIGVSLSHPVTEAETVSYGSSGDQFEKNEITDIYKDTSSLISRSTISSNGGVIKIDGTGVELYIPPNAFEEKVDRQIDLKIIPQSRYWNAGSFEDNSTCTVELLPNKISFKEPLKLTLPHCLKLESTDNCEVQVFASHHESGQEPLWEDITKKVSYTLFESYCEIHLKMFCWIKCNIRGAEVTGKKIVTYVVGERCSEDARYVTVDVGFHLDLPGSNKEYLKKLQERFYGDSQPFLFFKEPQNDLTISLEEILNGWNLTELSQKEMKLQYDYIEASMEQSFPVTLFRDENTFGLPRCRFKVSQGLGLESYLAIAFTPQKSLSNMIGRIIVPERIIHSLSLKIGAEWKEVGRNLGTEETNFHSISCEEERHQDKTFRMLNEWRQREGRNGNIQKLQAALRSASRADLADQLLNGDVLNSLIQTENFLGNDKGICGRCNENSEGNKKGRKVCTIL